MKPESIARFLEKIDNLEAGKRAECISDLSAAFKGLDGNSIKNFDELVESWKLLDDAGRTGLKTDVKAIEALQNLRTHSKIDALRTAGKIPLLARICNPCNKRAVNIIKCYHKIVVALVI